MSRTAKLTDLWHNKGTETREKTDRINLLSHHYLYYYFMHLSHKLAFIDFLFHSLTITWNNTPPPTQKNVFKNTDWYLVSQTPAPNVWFLKKKKKKVAHILKRNHTLLFCFHKTPPRSVFNMLLHQSAYKVEFNSYFSWQLSLNNRYCVALRPAFVLWQS